MSKIKWDQNGERKYKIGVDHGVIYPMVDGAYPEGFAWNGLTSVNETPSGAEDNPQWADNMKYANIKSAEELGVTIECLMYPKEFEECDGKAEMSDGVILGQQARQMFGFSYRNKIGNDTEGEDHGFEIHVIYGCSASPSEQSNTTINDSPETATFSFELSTTPVAVSGVNEKGKPFRPVASITFDSTRMSRENMVKLEEILYGKDGAGDSDTGTSGRLPLPDEFKTLFAAG